MNSNGFTDDKKRQIASFIIIWMILGTFIVIIIPIQTPTVKAVAHLGSCAAEDAAGMPYDIGPTGDGEVIWDPMGTHNVNEYIVEEDMTLNIPPLNYTFGNPGETKISISGRNGMHVYGRLITNSDGDWLTKTFFNNTSSIIPSMGIYFHPGSEACLVDSRFSHFEWGVLFYPGSKLISPGIQDSQFVDNVANGLQLNGVTGYTYMNNTYFDDKTPPKWTTPLDISNMYMNITNSRFLSSGPGYPQLHINNATVILDEVNFYNDNQKGNGIHIEGNSNGTVLNNVDFEDGRAGYHYIKSEGVSFLIDNTSFITSGGALSVLAKDNETTGVPSHLRVRNPTSDGWPSFYDNSFDNSTLNVTDNSTITLQWFQNVYVNDPDGNPVDNAPVWVKDGLGNPAEPSMKMTDITGWAKWITCTEKIITESSETYFNPYNASALNNTILAYANSEINMNMSKEVTITVPFNPIPNTAPWVSYIQTPSGVQSGLVNIQFILQDPDIGDDGNLSVTVRFWDPIASAWKIPTAHSTSDPTTKLKNNVLYTFVWYSDDVKDFPNKYSTDVKIRITPSDRVDVGTPFETGIFTVDNLLPSILSGPFVTPTNNSAQIQWTVNRDCDAVVWYGIDDNLTMEQTGTTGSTSQTVTLTDLFPGRKYSFVINSTTSVGIKNSSYPTTYTFETFIYIQLKKGLNMISFAPTYKDVATELVLQSISGQYDYVQWYDASDPKDPWKHYVPGKPFGNDLGHIIPEMGILIFMKNDALYIHDNIVPPTGGPPVSINLLKGWNMVGYPSAITRTVDDAMGSINYDLVQTYDAASGRWISWDGSSGDLINMELGRGYWIKVPSNQIWNVTYA
jgi:hypothetical protein